MGATPTGRRGPSRQQFLAGALTALAAAACAPNSSSGSTTVQAPAAGGAGSTASAGSTGGAPAAGASQLTVYAGADTNVQQLWASTLIPAFEKANPRYQVRFVFSEHGANDNAEYARLAASIKTGSKPPADLIADSGFIETAATSGQMAKVDAAGIPGLATVQPQLLVPVKGAAIPYRGSAVLLAYDSTRVKTPPRTLDDLLGWITAHPGKFTYNSPSTGGSGAAFVATVLDRHVSASARTALTTGNDASAEKEWDAGFAVLRGLTPSVYEKVYPNGNQAVLELLGKAQIWMAPVWSDQFLTAVGNGQLGRQVKVTQISNPSFTGGAAYLGIPTNSGNPDGARALADFVLQPAQQAAIVTSIAGFPAIPVGKLPAAQQKVLAGTNANNLRAGYSSTASDDINRLWQSKVPG